MRKKVEAAFTTCLFDLDGTISDPRVGITRSIQFALEKLKQPRLPVQELEQYIGPPLRGTFAYLLQTEDASRVEEAMRFFRQRFGSIGLFENEPYPGIQSLLAGLHRRRQTIYIATGKPRVFARRIVAHFQFDHYFAGIYGSELDGRFDHKVDLLDHLLRQEKVDPRRAVMIGDRRQDINAGRAHGLHTIGVTYGFGSEEELRAAGAGQLCHSINELAAALQAGAA